MIDFSYGAYPSGLTDLAMIDGSGEVRGRTVWMGSYHAAFAVYGDKMRFVGTAEGKHTAFAKIELWYAAQENYHAAFAA
ncbi:hypothetical protein Ssi03_13180 [Sphaerisporangium siamense]|uniref:Uncharacterized protein n=1 Tax=Sphaerisporangium siamense TaxID=795645 RepID=A0A7W7D9T8_9ACTN|nr:hypothetical protein [Sphaerisporangium siamense]MBB4702913.1 hypothetical protein [Sphaerisporangium siamense]GII83328.1 hypothetical protein Ssi03_13180 [Sphaerisporangium siamense]